MDSRHSGRSSSVSCHPRVCPQATISLGRGSPASWPRGTCADPQGRRGQGLGLFFPLEPAKGWRAGVWWAMTWQGPSPGQGLARGVDECHTVASQTFPQWLQGTWPQSRPQSLRGTRKVSSGWGVDCIPAAWPSPQTPVWHNPPGTAPAATAACFTAHVGRDLDLVPAGPTSGLDSSLSGGQTEQSLSHSRTVSDAAGDRVCFAHQHQTGCVRDA